METNHQNEQEDNGVAYTGLGVNNEPDNFNPGNEEASDTLLYTDTVTAQNATNEAPNGLDDDALPQDMLDEELTDDELDEQITELAEDEEEGNERY